MNYILLAVRVTTGNASDNEIETYRGRQQDEPKDDWRKRVRAIACDHLANLLERV